MALASYKVVAGLYYFSNMIVKGLMLINGDAKDTNGIRATNTGSGEMEGR